MEAPLAAAIGAGLDINKPEGHMVIDSGGGTTDVAVLSQNNVVESASIKSGGNAFDSALIKYIKRKHNVLIGEATSEELKKVVGCVFPRPETISI